MFRKSTEEKNKMKEIKIISCKVNQSLYLVNGVKDKMQETEEDDWATEDERKGSEEEIKPMEQLRNESRDQERIEVEINIRETTLGPKGHWFNSIG